jgi:hypothetical protein
MKVIEWIDGDGWKRKSMVKDSMLPEQAHQGIPRDLPDLRQLDCETVLKELHNLLYDRGLFTIADLNKFPNGLRGAIDAVIYPKVLALYKNHYKSGLNGGNAPTAKTRPKEALNEQSS